MISAISVNCGRSAEFRLAECHYVLIQSAGLEIKPRKVFGIPSEGMAMGKVDAPLDTDVSAQFDADAPERTFTVTLQVEVTARYSNDTEKLARKAVKSGKGQVVSVA